MEKKNNVAANRQETLKRLQTVQDLIAGRLYAGAIGLEDMGKDFNSLWEWTRILDPEIDGLDKALFKNLDKLHTKATDEESRRQLRAIDDGLMTYRASVIDAAFRVGVAMASVLCGPSPKNGVCSFNGVANLARRRQLEGEGGDEAKN